MQTGAGGPPEAVEAVWLILRVAADANVIVVSAAGNGNQNLDGDAYEDFRSWGDSGSIIIGAGSSDTEHNKLSFSTYGERVNVHSWGQNVMTAGAFRRDTTALLVAHPTGLSRVDFLLRRLLHCSMLGYGVCEFDGCEGAANCPVQRHYTPRYSGTSSASALTAGAVTAIQSYAKQQLGAVLLPPEMRDLLTRTGTPQGDPENGDIGPFIQMRSAIEELIDRKMTVLPALGAAH